MHLRLLLLAVAFTCLGFTAPADARIKRSQSAKVPKCQSRIQVSTSMPVRGCIERPCKGYVIDHVKSLACGGADRPENMQWQTVAEGKAKDKWERRECGK